MLEIALWILMLADPDVKKPTTDTPHIIEIKADKTKIIYDYSVVEKEN